MSVPTIDSESKQRIRAPYSFDNFTERLVTENGYFVLPSTTMWTLKKNIYFLLKNCRKDQFQQKYTMKPDYLSYDEYGTVIMAPILMWINNVSCIEEFSLTEIMIPTKESIVYICRDSFKFKEVEKLNSVNF